MNPTERRNLGAHYTSETNILKLIRPLFLDDLWREFESIKDNKNKLLEFPKRLSTLKFLDPACGCGNFLVITYRELRLLELEILRNLYKHGQQVLSISDIIWLDVDQFYGIEYEEFPARIAEVAMWLIDHQMNMLISNEFGQYFARLPLKKAAKIVHCDALKTDWQSLLNPENEINVIAKHANIYLVNEPITEYKTVNVQTETFEIHKGKKADLNQEIRFDYILGNPPFIGSKMMSQLQRDSVVKELDHIQGSGVLDYVTAWYIKAAKYIQGTKSRVAFVSTNSIVQGEQTSILWGQMLKKYNIKIHFAHRTFKWSNEAKGNAAVYCVIIGFANFDTSNKRLFEYEDIKGEAHELKVNNINPYLVDAKNILIEKRRTPLCNVPKIVFGNMPNDGGNLLLDDDEKNELLKSNPELEKYIKPLIGAHEYLNGIKKWCFWLVGFDEIELKANKVLKIRLDNIHRLRTKSTRPGTQALANKPHLFGEIRQPDSDFIYIPLTSSENRTLVPFGFLSKDYIANNTGSIIPNANLYHFGILQSKMHFAWIKYVCGRLKSDFRYSNEIVYNNFPWPDEIDDGQKTKIETAAQKILDARKLRPTWGAGVFYSPLSGVSEIVKAHRELDKAVDQAYRPQPFTSEANRMVFLFELYEKYTADLFTKVKPQKINKNKDIL